MQFKKCPDCSAELEAGYIIDHTYGSTLVQRYVKAEAPKVNKSVIWLRETEFSDIRRVITYRCVNCNRLFSYAQDFLSASNEKISSTYSTSSVIIKISLVLGLGLILYICGLLFLNL
jgi:DNA-directed RNA polymerase subunit RPC12/RpoP